MGDSPSPIRRRGRSPADLARGGRSPSPGRTRSPLTRAVRAPLPRLLAEGGRQTRSLLPTEIMNRGVNPNVPRAAPAEVRERYLHVWNNGPCFSEDATVPGWKLHITDLCPGTRREDVRALLIQGLRDNFHSALDYASDLFDVNVTRGRTLDRSDPESEKSIQCFITAADPALICCFFDIAWGWYSMREGRPYYVNLKFTDPARVHTTRLSGDRRMDPATDPAYRPGRRMESDPAARGRRAADPMSARGSRESPPPRERTRDDRERRAAPVPHRQRRSDPEQTRGMHSDPAPRRSDPAPRRR